jgi:signal transduction histidine kinase
MLSVLALGTICLANITLAISVLANNSRVSLNRVYAALVADLALWSVIVYLEDTPLGHQNIQALAKLDYFLATILVGLFFWFCKTLYGLKHRLAELAILGLGLFSAALIVTGNTVRVAFQGTNVAFEPKPGFAVFITYMFALVIFGLALLWKKFSTTTGKLHVQIRYIGLGFFLTITGVVVADIIVPRVFAISSPEVSRVGIYSTILFTAFCWYAIVRHRFMDVRLLVARSVTYLLLLTSLAALYGIGIFGISSVFFQTSHGNIAQNLTYASLSVILAFTFQPLRRFFERVTNNVFYQDHYDSQEVINRFSQILVSELDLNKLLKKSLAQLCESVHIQFGQLVIFNHNDVYRVEHYGPLPQRLMVAPELHTLKRSMLIADELTGGARKQLMDSHGVRVSMMLASREEFVGYLLMGDKLSGDIYSSQDIELLEIISKELAVAIQNAKAYAEISEFNITLQARVDHATNRLRVANRHLKELDKAKDEFISMASHQLRTPLTTIKGYLSMLSEGDAGKISDDQKQFVQFAFDASERMVRLISDLLNVSRLSAGRFLIQTKPTDMVAMIDDEVRQLTPHAKAKNLQLIFERPSEPLPPAQIDDNKTRQVVMNFIDNAIYYTPVGEVRVKLSQTGDSVRLEVRDTGIGVPEDAKRKLFSKFYRADNAQTVRPDGTGLGLYLAKRVIQDQGGTIIFNSSEGKGSTFGFELPLKAIHQPSTHHEEHHAASRSQ